MIKMTGYRILVKLDNLITTTESGIVTVAPDKEKLEKTGIHRGIVIDVGPCAWKAFREVDEKGKEHNGETWCKPGDYVIFARSAGRFIYDPFEDKEDNKNEYIVMNDEDIIAIMTEGSNPTFKKPEVS